jgi:hypothetical protein
MACLVLEQIGSSNAPTHHTTGCKQASQRVIRSTTSRECWCGAGSIAHHLHMGGVQLASLRLSSRRSALLKLLMYRCRLL